ncbi:hypothetical protein OUZ56_008426 [Daphnia magna]|uniref:Uncharacterized protein n=1 Tax=Daphnia magna TaxID=35525 RepID=A0ABR0ACY0_9CRUS|nr:hypothetical protein OUZ56_008426 [Daphnia magna]
MTTEKKINAGVPAAARENFSFSLASSPVYFPSAALLLFAVFSCALKTIEILTGNEAMATLTPVPLMDAPSRPPNARHIHNHQLGRQDSFSDMLPFLLEIVNLLPNTTSES